MPSQASFPGMGAGTHTGPSRQAALNRQQRVLAGQQRRHNAGAGRTTAGANRRNRATTNQRRRRNAAAGRTPGPAPRANSTAQPSLFDPGPTQAARRQSSMARGNALGVSMGRSNVNSTISAQQAALNTERAKNTRAAGSPAKAVSSRVTRMGRVGMAAGAVGIGGAMFANRRSSGTGHNQSLYR